MIVPQKLMLFTLIVLSMIAFLRLDVVAQETQEKTLTATYKFSLTIDAKLEIANPPALPKPRPRSGKWGPVRNILRRRSGRTDERKEKGELVRDW